VTRVSPRLLSLHFLSHLPYAYCCTSSTYPLPLLLLLHALYFSSFSFSSSREVTAVVMVDLQIGEMLPRKIKELGRMIMW
jgi:hypothetical protein